MNRHGNKSEREREKEKHFRYYYHHTDIKNRNRQCGYGQKALYSTHFTMAQGKTKEKKQLHFQTKLLKPFLINILEVKRLFVGGKRGFV